MDKYFILAGTIVRVTAPDNIMPRSFKTLESFLVAPQRYDCEICLTVVDELSKPEGNCIFKDGGKCVFLDGGTLISYIGSVGITLDGAYLRLHRNGTVSHAEVKGSALRETITSRVILDVLECEHLIVSGGGLLLHSSYIAHAGGAILFTAPSGTGKTTQAALWEKLRGAEIINGDRSVVRIREGIAEAWGIPFSGSSGICKVRTLPVKAIVYLSQAPVTTIQELSGIRAFRLLWEGCSLQSWNREDVERCSATLMDVISKIPVFHLACTPDESAVIALEKALRRLEKHDSEK